MLKSGKMEPSLIETSLDWCDDETGAFGGEKCASLLTSDENVGGGASGGTTGGEESIINSSIYTPTSLFSNEHEQTTDDDNLDTNFSTDSLDRLHPLYEGNRYEYKLTMFENLNEQQAHGRGSSTTTMTEKDNKNNRNAVTATNQGGFANQNQNTTRMNTTGTTFMNQNQNQNFVSGQQQQQQPVIMRKRNVMRTGENPTLVCCYPSYALPDLTFLQQNSANAAKIKLNPYTFQPSGASSSDVSMASLSSVSSGKRYPTPVSGMSIASGCGSTSRVPRSTSSRFSSGSSRGGSGSSRPRPVSLNDLEALKAKVVDWDSLCFLLPPEVKAMFGEEETSKKKRFSLQEPIREHEILELTNDLDKNLGLYQGLVGDSTLGDGTEYDAMADSIHKTISSLKLHRSARSSTPQLSQLFSQLYTLLGSGLQPTLHTLFGPVPNTVWRMIEASVHNGGQLQELVLRINAEDSVDDGPVKVGCFLRGLANLSLLPTYLSYLRTKERLLRTHYASTAFMYLSSTSTRHLFDKILGSLQEVQSRTRFELDIFEEAKEVLMKLRKTSGTKSRASTAYPGGGRKTHSRYSGKPTSTADRYGGQYGQYGDRMKRSQSEDEIRGRNKTAPVRTIPKSQTQHAHGGLEKGMLEAEQNTFRKLRMQWEEKSMSRIPRLVTNSGMSTKYYK